MKAEGTGRGQGNHEALDLERLAEMRESRLGSGRSPIAPGSNVVHGALGPGAAWPGPSCQGAKEPNRRHSP